MMVDAGLISADFGGFFTAACILSVPLLVMATRHNPRPRVKLNSVIVPLFFFFNIAVIVSALIGISTGKSEEITNPHLAFSFKFIVLYYVARMICVNDRKFQRITIFALLAIVFFTLYTASAERILEANIARQVNEDFQIDYQGMAYAYVVLAMFGLVSAGRPWRIVLYSLSLPILFIVGARSEFVAFLLIALTFEFCKSRSRPKFALMAIAAVLLVTLAYSALDNSMQDNRIFGLLDIQNDESAIERRSLTSEAISTISQNPILGNYASYLPGNYAHNILSAWVDLGILGFIALLIIVLGPVIYLLRRFSIDGRDPTFIICLAAALATLLLILLAKNYNYQFIPVSVGLYARYLMLSRIRVGHTNRNGSGFKADRAATFVAVQAPVSA